jgi:hypothetical protein
MVGIGEGGQDLGADGGGVVRLEIAHGRRF